VTGLPQKRPQVFPAEFRSELTFSISQFKPCFALQAAKLSMTKEL